MDHKRNGVMDKYQKIMKEKKSDVDIEENEVRITQRGKVRSSISYVYSLFEVRSLIGMSC